jgi:hypothetical protein
MLSSCTLNDSLNIAHEICHFSDKSMQRAIYVYTITCYSIAIIFVLLRVLGRLVAGRFAFDDYIVVAALLFKAIPLGLVLKMAGIDFTENHWNLQEGQLLRFSYVAWTTYTFVLGLTKIALTLFYYEIFPLLQARMRYLILLGWVATNTLALVFLTVYNCRCMFLTTQCTSGVISLQSTLFIVLSSFLFFSHLRGSILVTNVYHRRQDLCKLSPDPSISYQALIPPIRDNDCTS